MTKIRTLLMALPMLAMAGPSFAGDLSGNYLITLVVGRPSGLKGAQACLTLTQTSGILGWTNSGTFSVGGEPAGSYYVVHGVITLATTASDTGNYSVLSGTIAKGTISNTSYIDVTNGVVDQTGTFTAAPGGC